MSRHVLLTVCVFVFSSAVTTGDDWPHFRGPGYDKISDETEWSPKALEPTPKVAWKTDIGIGYAGPAVVGDAVYAMGFSEGEEHVRRLAVSNGETVWTRSYPGAKVDNLNAGGPGATPTVVGDVVYTNGREGQVYCLKVSDGSIVWNVDLPETFGVKVPVWGFTSSPLLVEDKIVVDAGRLVALDPKSGEVIWKADKEYKPGYGTPSIMTFKGETYLAHLNNDGVTVVNAADGKEAAFYPVEARFDTAATSPIIKDDTLWISVGYGGICALLRFTGNELEEVYENKELSNHFDTSVLIDGYVYGVNGQSNNGRTCTLVCMEHATGEVAWEQRGGSFGSLIAANDHLIYLNDVGTAAIIPANPKKFEFVSKGDLLDGQCWTSPVLANGRLYCRNSEGTLIAVDLTP